MSRTQEAIAWLESAPPDEHRTMYAAAKLFGLHQSAITAHYRRVRGIVCPHCHHTILPKKRA